MIIFVGKTCKLTITSSPFLLLSRVDSWILCCVSRLVYITAKIKAEIDINMT